MTGTRKVDTSSRQELCELLRSIGRIELLGDPSEDFDNERHFARSIANDIIRARSYGVVKAKSALSRS